MGPNLEGRVRTSSIVSVLLGSVAITFVACGGGSSKETSSSSAPGAGRAAVSTNKDDYPVFPNKDAGADPSVPAEQGGKGFTGEGWETNTDFDLIGDPRAIKGGILRDYALNFPGTLRMGGPEWNTSLNYTISSLVYESLVGLHPTTLKFLPAIATHWKTDPDKVTYRFRIDPNAKFSDGTPVTSEDVVASWVFYTDKTLQDLYFTTEYGRLEKPVAESKYIVRIKAKTPAWQTFLVASGLRVFPAHVLKTVDGATYLRDYNFKLIPGTGPYVLNEADIKKGTSITLRRRKDYWAADYRANIGQYNFDEMRTTVIRDQNLAFETFKRGDLDYYYVNISKQWVEEFGFDSVQRGLIVKRKVFNNYPANTQFLAFNTRRQPWDDVRVRQAFALLLNRPQLIDQLFFNEYLPLNSFFPGTAYENPDNPKNQYNPEEALRLLAEAGWKDRDAQGRLVKGGRPLQIELLYADKGSERWLTVYQNDLRKVGITLNLRLVTGETLWKMKMQRQFELASGAWSAGGVFPTPRAMFHSTSADQLNNNNISGLKDKRIDEILEKYDAEFDPAKREVLLRELDGLFMKQHHYINEWYPPASTRMAFWNRFGYPQGTFSRIGDYGGSLGPGLPQLWWVDPEKDAKLQQALRDKSLKLEIPPVEDRYWQEFSKKQALPISTN
jgi:microcin C transport system substrate-binding protein